MHNQRRIPGRWTLPSLVLTLGIVIAMVLVFVPSAQADNVQNDVSANGNTSIPSGGTTTVKYWISANSSDGQKDCNAADGSPATVYLIVPAQVTSSNSSLDFSACGNQNSNTISVSFTSSTPGDYYIYVSSVADTGTGTYNSSKADFTLHVTVPTSSDTTPPVLTLPGNIIAEATSSSGATVTYTASANDAVDGPVAITCAPASGSTFPILTTTVNCSATDSHNNTASGTFTVTVQDTTPPTVTPPASVTAEAAGSTGATVTYGVASAFDLVDGVLGGSCTPLSGSLFPIGVSTVTCTAMDAHNNTGSSSFTVTVQDTTAPTLTLPSPITVEATGSGGATVNYTASASDLVDGSVAVGCSPASGATFPLGTTIVSCSATDAHSNTASGSFTITVQDTTVPVLSLINLSAEATGPSGAVVTFAPTASDLVDGLLPVTCNPVSGSTFPLGLTTVSCYATNSHSNTANGSFTVEVEDTTPPALSLPATISAEATGPLGAVVTYTASATDIVDGSVAVSCSPASGSIFPIATTTVTCSATNSHSNTANGSFTVEVKDTTPPTLSLPAPITAEATGPLGAVVTYTASATDIVDGSVAVSCSPASGSIFPIATTTVTCSATDAHNNTGYGSFSVIVEDTTPPTLSLPTDITAEATGPGGASVAFSPTATDLVDLTDPVDCIPASNSIFALGTTIVNCSAKDAHGNKATGSFSVTVNDTTAPALTLPGPITAEATGPSGAVVTYTGSANDLVDGAVAVTCTPASGSTFALGTIPVNCSATDAHGNTSTGSFTVEVKDTTPPIMVLPGNITAHATGASTAVVTFIASAGDLVDGVVVVNCSPVSGSTFALGTTTVNCSATDAHGNTASGSFTVTVDYAWNGFFQPVDNNMLNSVKAGSAIPVKFSLNGNQGLNIFAAGYPVSRSLACGTAVQDDIEETVTAGSSSLTYDPVANQYIYVWKTDKGWANSCRTLVVKLADGTMHTANFSFKK